MLSNPLLELGLIPDLPGGDATEPTDVDVGAAKRSARQADEESTAAVDSSDIVSTGVERARWDVVARIGPGRGRK